MTEVIEKKESEKKLIINRHTVFTIPNIIVFFRILCVPVYMTLVILSSKEAYAAQKNLFLFLGLGILILAAISDVVDGKIARKYKAGTKIGKYTVKHDQGTYIGQCIDPIADKVMHIGALIALSVAGYLHWIFIVLLVAREACMIIIGSFMVNDINIQANMLGKVASATISVGVILSFFHPWISQLWGEFGIDWIVVTIGLALNWTAAIGYAIDAAKQVKAKKEQDAEALVLSAVDTKDDKVDDTQKD
ncbi:MAG: CDP-alcohol phosphatidyltransferase family protein [Clostridiales bacterium]|nr:CDP-alcohol phosphatidyltransferase family protein [Clostridiales bacterium]